MFKFEKGDHVSFVYGSVLSPNPDGAFQAVVNGGEIIARKGCGSSGGPEYRVAGFSGWWTEENLVLVSKGSEKPLSRKKAEDPTLDRDKCRELYLKALKKTYGKVPFESETVEVGSLLDFTEAVLAATKEA